MARDIEEFLRRAAERRKQSQGGGAASPPPKAAPPRPPQAPPKQRLAQEQVLRPDEVDPYARKESEAIPQAAPPRPPTPMKQPSRQPKRRQTVGEHVKQAIDVSDVTEHSSQLGAHVGQADERLEARLEKFDHSMGALDGTATITDDETAKVEGPDRSKLAIDLLQLFSEPKSIRQSILISEVLKRPAFFEDDDDE